MISHRLLSGQFFSSQRYIRFTNVLCNQIVFTFGHRFPIRIFFLHFIFLYTSNYSAPWRNRRARYFSIMCYLRRFFLILGFARSVFCRANSVIIAFVVILRTNRMLADLRIVALTSVSINRRSGSTDRPMLIEHAILGRIRRRLFNVLIVINVMV